MATSVDKSSLSVELLYNNGNSGILWSAYWWRHENVFEMKCHHYLFFNVELKYKSCATPLFYRYAR